MRPTEIKCHPLRYNATKGPLPDRYICPGSGPLNKREKSMKKIYESKTLFVL